MGTSSQQPASGFIPAALGDDYTFLNFESYQTNSWAGARHWKFAPKRAAVGDKSMKLRDITSSSSASSNLPTNTQVISTARSKAPSGEKFFFVFDGSEVESGDALKVDLKKTSNTLLTCSALEKAAEVAKEGAYTLPPDAKLGPKVMRNLTLPCLHNDFFITNRDVYNLDLY